MRVPRRLRLLASVLAAGVALAAPAAAQGAFDLLIKPQGAGHGSIAGTSPVSATTISCIWDGSEARGVCSDTVFTPGTPYTITASPIEGAVFAGWDGTCPTTPAGATGNVCSFNASSAITLRPTFAVPTVTVTKSGDGSGTVTSAPAGINCGSDCTESFNSGTSLTLTAAAAAGSTFAGWGGACAAAPATGPCTLTASNPEIAVTATFTAGAAGGGSTSTLTVVKTGPGDGSISSSPAGIDCGTTCSIAFPAGTKVTLTAAANDASEIGAWGGACASATGSTCTLTLTGAAVGVSLAFTERASDVQADLIAVRVKRSRLGLRVVQVEISADERISAVLVLKRGKKTLATRRVAAFPPGDRVLRLVVPASVAGGKAKLKIELSDAAGGTASWTRTVRLPRAG